MNWTVVGFPNQKQLFERCVKEGSLAHAYLFTGPAMIGKFQFAKELAMLVNERGITNDPDVTIVAPRTDEGETKIYIEDIRDLKNFLSYKPYQGPYKFAIINDAERLTPEASNALLKALEEPNPKSILILIAANPQQLLTTVVSRCQHISFTGHNVEQIKDFLKARKVKGEEAEMLTTLAQGRLGWLASVLDSKETSSIKKSIDEFNKILKTGIAERMVFAKKLIEKEDYPKLISSWIHWTYANQKEIPQSSKVLKNLLSLNSVIAQPQFNHRLALENFLISLS